MSDCTRRPGCQCSLCTSPNVATQFLDPDTEEVLASCEGTDSEETIPCCAKCLSPDVTTELIQGTPWEVGFYSVLGITGSTHVRWDALYFYFTVYPGVDLPWVQVWWESDYYVPDGAVTILDEDGNPVLPWEWNEIDEDGEDWTMIYDPVEGTVPGDITVTLHRRTEPTQPAPKPSKCIGMDLYEWYNSQWNLVQTDSYACGYVLPGDIEIEDPEDDNHISFYHHYPLSFCVMAGGDTQAKSIVFGRASGADDLYWSLAFTPDTAWTGYSLYQNATPIVAGTVYGPMAGPTLEYVSMAVDPTTLPLVDGEVYSGVLTLNGYTDAAGANLVNTDTRNVTVKVDILCGIGFLIEPSVANITRGSVFQLNVTAKKLWTMLAAPLDSIEFCETYEEYEGGLLNLNMNCQYDPADNISPIEYDSTGQWTDGVLAIPNCVISGGSGSETPDLQVMDITYGVDGITELAFVPGGFNVIAIPNITRGAAFNLVLQAVDVDGAPDTAYTPAGNVDIDLTSSDGADSIAPLFTDNTGWVDGKKTVACTITGGAGSDSYTIDVEDPATSATGSESGAIAAATSTVSRYIDYAWVGQGTGSGGWIEADWNSAFATMYATFLVGGGLFRAINADWNVIDSGGNVRWTTAAGYTWLDVTNPQKAKTLVNCTLTITSSIATRVPRGGAGVVSYWGDAYGKSLALKFTNTPTSYTNGAQIAAMTPDLVISFEEINERMLIQEAAQWPVATSAINIKIPNSVINSLVGNILCVWFYIIGADDVPAFGDFEISANLSGANITLYE